MTCGATVGSQISLSDMRALTETAVDVIKSILPEDLHGEIPVGFNTAGHIGEQS